MSSEIVGDLSFFISFSFIKISVGGEGEDIKKIHF